ncbi:wall-associated receptor kinase 4-like [Mercurialis annua]|uniref:wall-associated receptor kinase 4-like n=1 Tax=Mercurialis annua TaxID=3986 RepID=UPI00215E5F86|nr:wall-associated receptor kinase 4-like [Mercurialis annua]
MRIWVKSTILQREGANKKGLKGVSIGILVLLLAVSWLYFGLRKARLIKLKEKYFKENGGNLFMQKNSEHGPNSTKAAKIYTENDLKKATNNFHESRILGKGGQGTVYKGTLPDNQIVAVKKSKIGDDTQVEGFINEVIILSQINHRNIVKLLGCCLETRVPLLVYEFVMNGTLFDHIHSNNGTDGRILIPWETRLRIATEVAEALSYMHSSASIPIIHRDIKSANILLDKNYTAKVSDFGASKLIPLDKTELTTLVQGTLGYLDPEYLHSSQLTEKSDVYSFGVVLIELLTRKRPISFTRIEEERNLAMYFVTSIQKDRLLQVVDYLLINEKNTDDIKRVSMLAKRCVSVKGDERPTMKDVAIELRSLCSTTKNPCEKNDVLCEQETQSSLPNSSACFIMDATSNSIAMNDSVMNSAIFEIGSGR